MTEKSPSSVAERRYRFQRSAPDWDRTAVQALLLGAALRIVWILIVHPPVGYVFSDMREYVLRGQGLATGASLTPGFAFFPPGTQFLLSVPLRLFGFTSGLRVAAVLWCLLSIAAVYAAWRLARALLSPAAAAVTAILCAVSPLFITYGGYFTSETPALASLIAGLWAGVEAASREGRAAVTLALLSGVLGGVATAMRPQLLINVLIAMAVFHLVGRAGAARLSAFLVGLVVVLTMVVIANSIASGAPTGLARNGGVNFVFGHCDAQAVIVVDSAGRRTAGIRHPVPAQAGRPGEIVVKNQDLWDETAFLRLGWGCIEQDGVGHVLRLGRNVLDMAATTTPWPQSTADDWTRPVVQASNIVYAVLLPGIVVASVLLCRRRRRDRAEAGEVFLLVNLACVVVVAILVLGDPRIRTVYDVFGLALLASLVADRFHLDRPPSPAATEDAQ